MAIHFEKTYDLVIFTLLAILVMNDFISNCVGHDFWHGASAHLRHLAASLRAPLSLRVVGLTSEKLFSNEGHVCIKILSFKYARLV